MYGGCTTCKHGCMKEHCKGCVWDDKAQRNTHWEPQEPFINKPCVSEQACHEDKMKVLEKIKERIELERLGYPPSAAYYKAIIKCLQIIDKYMEVSDEEVKRRTEIMNDVNEALSKYGLTIGMYNFEGEGGFIELYLDKIIGK